ncbi:MAG: hypothetical protein NTX25_04575 [Proteobacteria bacterium]|nr:hypothetical protein [Pseudomonadota bacterium]
MRKPDYDSRILIYRSRQWSLFLLVVFMTVGAAIWLMQGQEKNLTWWKIGVPLCASCSLFLLYPPTEEWEYKPWQAKTRKIEQHFER